MKLFHKSYDGGADSGVTGYWLVEIKSLFSIVLLHFNPGSRDAYHSHAFSALTWWLKGNVKEQFYDPEMYGHIDLNWSPSWVPKYTPKRNFHRIVAGEKGAWALSIRGPWDRTWKEHKNGETYELTHGRQLVTSSDSKEQ